MITVYGMETCPDCAFVHQQMAEGDGFDFVNIGESPKNLKAFLRLRDANPVFDKVKAAGSIGIPCFVREDGSLTLKPEDVGLKSRPTGNDASGAACRIDGSGC